MICRNCFSTALKWHTKDVIWRKLPSTNITHFLIKKLFWRYKNYNGSPLNMSFWSIQACISERGKDCSSKSQNTASAPRAVAYFSWLFCTKSFAKSSLVDSKVRFREFLHSESFFCCIIYIWQRMAVFESRFISKRSLVSVTFAI